MAARVARESMVAMAETAAMAAMVTRPMVLPGPMRLRVLLLKMAATGPMAPTVAMAVRAEPGATHWAESTEPAEMAATVETQALRAMEAPAVPAVPSFRMAEMAEMAAIPAWLASAAWAAL